MSKRLSPAEWAEIVVLYERGEFTQEELANRFDVSRQAIHTGLKQRGVVMGSKLKDVVSEAEEAARAVRQRRMEEAAQFKDRFNKFNMMIANMVMKKVGTAEAAGTLGAINAELVTLRTASRIIKTAREESYVLLDLDNIEVEEDTLPELAVSVYTAEELEAISKANEESFNANTLGDDDDDGEDGDDD